MKLPRFFCDDPFKHQLTSNNPKIHLYICYIISKRRFTFFEGNPYIVL
jgi:hypothetical protein